MIIILPVIFECTHIVCCATYTHKKIYFPSRIRDARTNGAIARESWFACTFKGWHEKGNFVGTSGHRLIVAIVEFAFFIQFNIGGVTFIAIGTRRVDGWQHVIPRETFTYVGTGSVNIECPGFGFSHQRKKAAEETTTKETFEWRIERGRGLGGSKKRFD